MILVSIFAVLTAVGALVKIPVGIVPMTFQLLFVLTAGVVLGSRLGALSQIIYIAMGLIGIPVFAKGGGPQYILEPSFGYIMGFVVAAFLTGLIIEKFSKNPKAPKFLIVLAACLAGMIASYVLGIAYLYLIRNVRFGANISLFYAIQIGTGILIWKDIIICFAIAAIPLKFLKLRRGSPAQV